MERTKGALSRIDQREDRRMHQASRKYEQTFERDAWVAEGQAKAISKINSARRMAETAEERLRDAIDDRKGLFCDSPS